MCDAQGCIAMPAGEIDLLNAAHDVTCEGCGWCDYTGEAVPRAIEAASAC